MTGLNVYLTAICSTSMPTHSHILFQWTMRFSRLDFVPQKSYRSSPDECKGKVVARLKQHQVKGWPVFGLNFAFICLIFISFEQKGLATMKCSKCLRALSVFLLVSTFSSLSQAELVNADWYTGDGKAAIDTATDKGWLDITETAGYSITSIMPELEEGGLFHGWRLATALEVEQMFVPQMPSWGLVVGDTRTRIRKSNSDLRYSNADVDAFRSALGFKYEYYTSPSSNGKGTRAYTIDEDGDVVLTGTYRHHYWNGPYDEINLNLGKGNYTVDTSTGSRGIWLVADNASVRLGGENGIKNVDTPAGMLVVMLAGLFVFSYHRKLEQ